MKKLIAAAIFMAMCIPLSTLAQTPAEEADTVKVIDRADIVTVARDGNTTIIESVTGKPGNNTETFTYSVTVDEADEGSWDIDLPFFSTSKTTCPTSGRIETNLKSGRLHTSLIGFEHFYCGQRFNYYDKGNVRNSMEIGIRNVIGLRWSIGRWVPSFSIGLGFSYRFYGAADGFVYSKEGSRLVLTPVEDGFRKKDSRLDVLTFQIPLMLTQRLGNHAKLSLGAVACLNTYAEAKSVCKEGDIKHSITYKGLQQRLFTTEIVGSIGVWDFVGIYASWSPITLFQAPYGPQLKSWSLGATLIF